MTSIWQKNVDNLQSRNFTCYQSVSRKNSLLKSSVGTSGESKKGMRGINTSLTCSLKTVNETHTEKLGRCDKWI